MIVPTPPGILNCSVEIIKQGVALSRIHASRFVATEFNPGCGNDARFSPLPNGRGGFVPTLYAGTSFDCAAYEYIFHDIDEAAAFKTVSLAKINRLSISTLIVTSPLRLAALREPDLNRWQMTRSQLIDTPPSLYPQTKLWAAAIHQSDPGLQGILWTSRRCDPETAMIFFGDRLGPSDLIAASTEEFAKTPARLEQVARCGRRAGITLTI